MLLLLLQPRARSLSSLIKSRIRCWNESSSTLILSEAPTAGATSELPEEMLMGGIGVAAVAAMGRTGAVLVEEDARLPAWIGGGGFGSGRGSKRGTSSSAAAAAPP